MVTLWNAVWLELLRAAEGVTRLAALGTKTQKDAQAVARLVAAIEAADAWDEPRVFKFSQYTFLGAGRNSEGTRLLVIREGLHGPFNEAGEFHTGESGHGVHAAVLGSESVVIELNPAAVNGLMQILGGTIIQEVIEGMQTRQ